MDTTNYWTGKEYMAYAIVNGLIGSASLWIFWTPFITFLALPISSAMTKQIICSVVDAIPSTNTLPPYVATNANILIKQDENGLLMSNIGYLSTFWLLAAFSVTLSFWLAQTVVNQANLDWNHIILFNSILFVCLIFLELCFFIYVGLQFIPFNLKDVYGEIITNLTTELNPFITT
jgi:hypothetical protein